MTQIGRDESQGLDVIPVQYGVIATRRPKLAVGPAKVWWRKNPRRRG
jgi:hypothetical protein